MEQAVLVKERFRKKNPFTENDSFIIIYYGFCSVCQVPVLSLIVYD